MAKDRVIGSRVDQHADQALTLAAQAYDRKKSWLVHKIVTDWLKAQGWLTDPPLGVGFKVRLICGACLKPRAMSMDACPNCGVLHSFAFVPEPAAE